MSLIADVRAALSPVGLNLVAALPVERYDRDVPEAYRLRKRYPRGQSLIVVGNGGGEFWSGFRDYCETHPGFREDDAEPLDRYTLFLIERELPALIAASGATGRLLYPFRFASDPVSFVHLGAVAGLGARSLLGVLVHPEYGPWIALRAAVLLDAPIEPTPIVPFDPCGTCMEKPCLRACPVAAVTERGWDVPLCSAYRLRGGGQTHPNCNDRCDARWQCVYGRAHRYPPDALAYHQACALTAMRA